MFPFDIFGFMSGFIILIFVIAIIFFVVVILIIYKLLHSNVNDVNKKRRSKNKESADTENIYRRKDEDMKEKSTTAKNMSICKFCREQIEENAIFCTYCGSNLST